MTITHTESYLAHKHTHSSVMTCFEYQKLRREDFANGSDFEYLLTQTLPCFDVVVQAGQLQLLVKHYLAKIVLPSGISLEILPKVSVFNDEFKQSLELKDHAYTHRQYQIESTRRWVKQMLIDISTNQLQKILPAIDLAGMAVPFNQRNSDATTLDKAVLDTTKPWYDWLLSLAEQKINGGKHALPNRYRTQAQNSPQARGKLNLKAQLQKNWHRPHYLNTEKSVLDSHPLIMQFMATGWQKLQQLQRQPINRGSDSISGKKTDKKLWVGVSLLPQAQWQLAYENIMRDKPHWQSQLATHQQTALEQALSWAWWVLNHHLMPSSELLNSSPPNEQSASLVNDLPLPALFINMNHAFEQWVLVRLKVWMQAHLPNSRLIIQPTLDWLITDSDEGSDATNETNPMVIQRLVPDAYVQSSDNSVSHVIDIKYKKIEGAHNIAGSDWQQVNTYQQYLQATNAWLIYPATVGFQQPVKVKVLPLERQQQIIDNTKMVAIPFDMVKRTLIY